MLCCTQYSTKIDIWAAGCILVELMTLDPIFKGAEEGDQLFAIFKIMGGLSTEDKDYYSKKVPFDPKLLSDIPSYKRNSHIIRDWTHGFQEREDIIDLISSIFKFNPEERPSAAEIQKHRFFDDARAQYGEHMKKGQV